MSQFVSNKLDGILQSPALQQRHCQGMVGRVVCWSTQREVFTKRSDFERAQQSVVDRCPAVQVVFLADVIVQQQRTDRMRSDESLVVLFARLRLHTHGRVHGHIEGLYFHCQQQVRTHFGSHCASDISIQGHSKWNKKDSHVCSQ